MADRFPRDELLSVTGYTQQGRSVVEAMEHLIETGKLQPALLRPQPTYESILVIECYLLGIKPVLNEADRTIYQQITEADLVVLQLPNARSGRVVKDRYGTLDSGHEEIDGRELAFLRRRGTVVAL